MTIALMRVGEALRDAGSEALADGGAERVDRRVVGDDDEDVVVDFGGDRAGHGSLLRRHPSDTPGSLWGGRCTRPGETPAFAGATVVGQVNAL
jgi:hypothetical protein